jgi:hypothetical protein
MRHRIAGVRGGRAAILEASETRVAAVPWCAHFPVSTARGRRAVAPSERVRALRLSESA